MLRSLFYSIIGHALFLTFIFIVAYLPAYQRKPKERKEVTIEFAQPTPELTPTPAPPTPSPTKRTDPPPRIVPEKEDKITFTPPPTPKPTIVVTPKPKTP